MEINGIYANTPKEIANEYGLSLNTVYSLIKSGEIDSVKLNGGYIVSITAKTFYRLNLARNHSEQIKKRIISKAEATEQPEQPEQK